MSGASAQSTPEAAYTQLCGPSGKASAATCTALRLELAPQSAAPGGETPLETATSAPVPARVVVDVDSDVRKGGKTDGFMGTRYAQHTFQTRPNHFYTVTLESTDRVNVTICNRPDPNTFSCFGRLDNWTVTSWQMGMVTTETVYLTVRGAGNKGAYRLRVEERPTTEALLAQWRAKNAVIRALPGQVFQATGGTLVSFVDVGGKPEVRIADTAGRFHRSAPFADGVGKGRFVFSGEDWVAKNVNTFNVATMLGSDSFVTYWDWGFGDHFRILPSGDLQTTRFAGGSPQNYFTLRRLPPSEVVQVTLAFEEARQRQFQAAQQRRDDRDTLIGQLFQGALIAGQSYAAGMQEASQANARAQAIIDAAAESDRQYRAAQAAALFAPRAASQPQSAPPPAPTRAAALPDTRLAPAAPAPASRPAPLPANGGGDYDLQPRTVQAYFVWGMALQPNSTRNPRCFSNIFSITYQSAANGSGDSGRAQAEAGRLASLFREKCERLGRMDPGTPPAEIGLPGVPFSAPYITAEDYQVTLP